ncbi:MAG: S8 family serine peptidase [Planctomycetes bacterium]|nr:S8 family serine peptidase [Planctomycetota bacterium]
MNIHGLDTAAILLFAVGGLPRVASAQPLAMQTDQGRATAALRNDGPFFEGQALPGRVPGTERWIVHFKDRPFDLAALRNESLGARRAPVVDGIVRDLERQMKAHQSTFVQAVEALGGEVYAQWWLVNACAVAIHPSRLDTIRKLENVAYLQPDVAVKPAIKTATNAANHNADALQAINVRGAGVTIAVIDTGHDSNMAGTGKPHITYSRRGTTTTRLVLNRKIGLMSADDVHGHGTAVDSVAAGWRWRTTTADDGHAYDSNIAGYAIANALDGTSSTSTMANAYTQMVIDSIPYGIRVSNMSYHGSPDPLSVEQKAMDAATNGTDILNVTCAGNTGTSTANSLINVNGISVGAVYENTHDLWTGTSHGIADGQVFPDIAANGVATNMAQRDNEYTDAIMTGTSMASPQVAGAAALLRAAQSTLRADETKAILLASTQTCQYSTVRQTSSGTGCGYLRDDLAYVVGSDPDRHGRATLSDSNRVWQRVLPVVKGQTYQFAIAWNRLDTNSSTWTDLNLYLRRGGATVLSSTTLRNSEEFIRYTATVTEYLTIEVSLNGSVVGGSSQSFGWASLTDTWSKIAGRYETYGIGCPGTPGGGGVILPAAYATKMGESANTFPHARANMRYQQVFLRKEVGASRWFNELCLRLDEYSGGDAELQVLTVKLGYTTRDDTNLTSSFATNVSGAMATVFSGKVYIHQWAGGNYSPTRCTICIPFDTNWYWSSTAGANLLVEIVNTSSSSTSHFEDAASSATAKTARLYATSATATTGTVSLHEGLVMCFRSTTLPAIPILANSLVPETNTSFDVNLARAKGNSAAALILGASKTTWGTVPLPLSLTGAGAPGCYLVASYDMLLGASATTSNGTAAFSIQVPSDASLVGKAFHNQWFVLDAGANTLGLSFSNGGTAIVGR